MSDGGGISQRASQGIYRGIWGVLSKLFKVPQTPPELPRRPGESYLAIKPARGFLNYMRFKLVWGLVVATVLVLVGVSGISFASLLGGLLSWPLAIVLELITAVLGFLAIHLRYDTTWYVLNERSMRLRRGIFIIKETTITFENIQNVSVKQGPVQRWFKISSIVVETAGGGGKNQEGGESAAHAGLIEGIEDAAAIRDLIMARMAKSRQSGLGDDEHHETPTQFSAEHLRRLKEIRDLICSL